MTSTIITALMAGCTRTLALAFATALCGCTSMHRGAAHDSIYGQPDTITPVAIDVEPTPLETAKEGFVREADDSQDYKLIIREFRRGKNSKDGCR